MLERIQKAELDDPALAVTRTSVLWPIPSVTTFVLYGFTGTKSLEITFMV